MWKWSFQEGLILVLPHCDKGISFFCRLVPDEVGKSQTSQTRYFRVHLGFERIVYNPPRKANMEPPTWRSLEAQTGTMEQYSGGYQLGLLDLEVGTLEHWNIGWARSYRYFISRIIQKWNGSSHCKKLNDIGRLIKHQKLCDLLWWQW